MKKKSSREPVGSVTQAAEIEATILRLLEERAPGKTICPSDAARAVAGSVESQWRKLMEPTREAAGRLVAKGRIVVTQRGIVVDIANVKGPIRLRLK